ncbi:pescadillo-like protein [Tanacetum coccineum]
MLALMRKFTKYKDIVRPGVTRFATSFLTLQSLMEKKEKLRLMFTSDEWTQSKWAKSKNGQLAYSIVMSLSFSNGVNLCIKMISPLVKVLRLADGYQKPSMGFLYGELKKANEDIKMAFNNVETYYRPIIDIIETRSKGRLLKDDVMVSNAVYAFLEKLFHHDFEKQDQVMNIELPKYKGKEGDFRRMLAAKGCSENNSSYDPGTWWMNYGNKTLILQKMAIKILSLTTSSFGCERNWNVFEGFNAKLINKWVRVKNQNIDILRSFDASKAQSWIINISDDEEIEEDGSLVVGGEVQLVLIENSTRMILCRMKNK